MKKKNSASPMVIIKAQSAAVLSECGNRLLLIEAIAFCFLTVPLYYALYTLCGVISTLTPEHLVLVWEIAYLLLAFLQTLFLTLPLCMGVFWIAGMLEEGQDAVLADVFYAFGASWRYLRALHVSWRLLVVCAPLIVVLYFAPWLLSMLIPLAWAVDLVMWVLRLVVLLGLFLLLYARFGLVAETVWEELDFERSRCVARISRRRQRACAGAFVRSYIGRILLGLLSVGILLLLDTLPHMLIAYFRACRYLDDSTI